MIAKAFTLPETYRPKFIELSLHASAVHIASEKAITSSLKPDLEWRRIVPGKRNEVDCPAKGQPAVFKRIGATKDFGVADCRNIEVLESCLSISLIEVKAV